MRREWRVGGRRMIGEMADDGVMVGSMVESLKVQGLQKRGNVQDSRFDSE